MLRLLRLPLRKWWMLGEAAFLLIAARVSVRFLPFSRISRYLGPLQPPVHQEPFATPHEIQTAKDVRWAIHAVAKRSPLEIVCLPQALAAWRMLQRRGVASRLHFGAPMDPVSTRPGLQTHAWLSSSGVEITGYPVAYGCVEVGYFSRVEQEQAKDEGVAVAIR